MHSVQFTTRFSRDLKLAILIEIVKKNQARSKLKIKGLILGVVKHYGI
jgi:hypothetical protein